MSDKIVRREEVETDMGVYIVTEYEGGTVVRELKSDTEGGEWVDTVREYQPTNAEIYENQLIIMEALADLYAGGVENG